MALLARVQYNLTMKAMYYINGQIDLTSYCLVNESLLLSALVVVYVLKIDVSFIFKNIDKKPNQELHTRIAIFSYIFLIPNNSNFYIDIYR